MLGLWSPNQSILKLVKMFVWFLHLLRKMWINIKHYLRGWYLYFNGLKMCGLCCCKTHEALSAEDSLDFDKVKGAVLRAYELVSEACRQKFCKLKKHYNQTWNL